MHSMHWNYNLFSIETGMHAAGSEAPVIPDILVNWHHDYHFQINVTHVSELSERAKAAHVRFFFMHAHC